MEALLQSSIAPMTDDSVEQMLALAERLRAANGGELDESAVQAVAEATGAPLEYVRLLVKIRVEKENKGLLPNLRAQFLTLGPETRRYVFSGVGASICALLMTLGNAMDRGTSSSGGGVAGGASYGLFGMLALVAMCGSAYNAALSRESRTAAISGAIFGGAYILMVSLFSFMFRVFVQIGEFEIVPFTLVGVGLGLGAFKLMQQNREKLGIRDPSHERQDLLRQLHTLQEQLTVGEQSVTFMSVDIVGSTKMKEQSDPLSIEFTFTEYHQFVERISRKHGGRTHSTAGDGVICSFEAPASAYAAARNIQAEMFEFNILRNKLNHPLQLRVGVHSGLIVAPTVGDPSSVNFAHVIDIAAHMEKACPPGGIAVSAAAATGISGGLQSIGPERLTVDGIEAALWTPKVHEQLIASSER